VYFSETAERVLTEISLIFFPISITISVKLANTCKSWLYLPTESNIKVLQLKQASVTFLPRCTECRRDLTMRILSVRPSVCPSVCQTRAL